MQGARQFAAKLGQLPRIVEVELRQALEQGAIEAVAAIDALAPPALKGRTRWVWGPPPKGARWKMTVGDGERLQVSIYTEDPAASARAALGAAGPASAADARAHWFEFGTGPRVQKTTGRKTGRMPATPFFFPGWRMARKRARSRIARALSRGIKKAGLSG